jgi:hypothetical protein
MKPIYFRTLLLTLLFALQFPKISFAQVPTGNPNCEVGDGLNVSLDDGTFLYLGGYGASKPLVRIPVLTKTDVFGKVLWKYTFQRNKVGELISAYKQNSALYVVCKYDSVSLPDTYTILEVSKMDALTGQRIWRKDIFKQATTYIGWYLRHYVIDIKEKDQNNIIVLHNRAGANDLVNYFNVLNKTTGAIANTYVRPKSLQLTEFAVDPTFNYVYGFGIDTVYKFSANNLDSVIWKTKISILANESRLFLKDDGVFIVTSAPFGSTTLQSKVYKLDKLTGNQVWGVTGNTFNHYVSDYTVRGNDLFVTWYYMYIGQVEYINTEKYDLGTGTFIWKTDHYLDDGNAQRFGQDIIAADTMVVLTGRANEEPGNSNQQYWFNYGISAATGREIYYKKIYLDTIIEDYSVGIKNHFINGKIINVGNFQAKNQPNVFAWYPKTNIGLLSLNLTGAENYRKILDFGIQPIIPPVVPSGICIGDTLWFSHKNVASATSEWFLNNQHYSFAADTFAILTSPATVKLTVNNGKCANAFTIPVAVSARPVLTTSGNVTINYGTPAQLAAFGAATYFWYPNVAISSQASRTPTVNPSRTTWYYVTGNNNPGCSKTDSVLVTVLNGPAGIEEGLNSGSAINIYPNPSSGLFSVELEGQQAAQVIVYNTLGQEMLTKTLSGNDKKVACQVDLGAVAKGIYLVQIRTEKQVINSKIVIE